MTAYCQHCGRPCGCSGLGTPKAIVLREPDPFLDRLGIALGLGEPITPCQIVRDVDMASIGPLERETDKEPERFDSIDGGFGPTGGIGPDGGVA